MINKDFLEKAFELQKRAQELTNNQGWNKEFFESMMKAFQGWGNVNSQASSNLEENIKMLSNLWSSSNSAIRQTKDLQFNINESDYEISINAPLPGVQNREDISVKILNDTVIISGKSKLGQKGKPRNFYRAIKLPANVDPKGASAVYSGGYLNIRLPKKTEDYYDVNVIFRS